MKTDLSALINSLRLLEQQKSMGDPRRFVGTTEFRALCPEHYVGGPPKVVMEPEEVEPFRREMRYYDALEDIIAGVWPDDRDMVRLFGISRAEIENELRDMSPIISPIPDKTIILSFDDASKDHIKHAAPILYRLGFNATFFIAELNDPVRGRYFHDKEKYMTWEEIRELSDMGFEVGNHTLNHRMSKGEVFDLQEFTDEANGLRDRCVAYGIPEPVSFGYPKGGCTLDQVNAARECGFLWGRGNVSEGICKTNGAIPYDPLCDSPLSMPSFGDAPTYTYVALERRAAMAKDGKMVGFAYHRVDDTRQWPGEGDFESQMCYLKDRGYKCIATRDLSTYIDPKLADAYTRIV